MSNRTRRSLRLLTHPVVEPITLDMARQHLRMDQFLDDDYIRALVTVCRQSAENYTRRAFIAQTWRLTLDRFPAWGDADDDHFWIYRRGIIKVEMPPIRSIDSITYIDTNGDTILLDPDLYVVDLQDAHSRIEPVYGQFWPITQFRMAAVTIDFTTGYATGSPSPDDDDTPAPPQDGDPRGLVPGPIKQAILLAMGEYYEYREQIVSAQVPFVLPMGAEYLLSQYIAMSF